MLEHNGRKTNILSLANDRKVIRPRTVKDLRNSGNLTVLKGSEIYDVFRAQFPVNPLISTQENLFKIDPQQTYLITSQRSLFKRLRNQLVDVYPYSTEGRVFNGVRYPKALILVTDRQKKDLNRQPVNLSADLEGSNRGNYLYLANLKSNDLPEKKLPESGNADLILSSQKILHDGSVSERLIEGFDEIHVLGKDTIFPDPTTLLETGKLLLVDQMKSGWWYQGSISPPGRSFYIFGLPILLASVGFLGLFLHGYPIRWALWLLVGISTYLFLSHWQLILTGLLAAGLVRLGFRTRSWTVSWFLLAGMIVFGFGYKPQQFDPFFAPSSFWGGAIPGFLLVSAGWTERLKSPVNYEDLLLGIVCLIVLLSATAGFGQQPDLTMLTYLTAFLPLAPVIMNLSADKYETIWLTGLGSWGFVFLEGKVSGAFFPFLVTMAIWALFQYLARRNSRVVSS